MKRKDDHLNYALKQKNFKNTFDNYSLKYYSIPNFNISDIDLSTNIGNIKLDYPFFINAITAGSKKADEINKKLEYVAKMTNIFFFPGSFSPFLNKESDNYPKGYGVNLGIDKDVNFHLEAIKKTNAKILQVHINLIQEILMPEGERDFSKWQYNLKKIVENVKIPIILKETGFGINDESIENAISLGIKIIDISGKNGTDFSKIENSRNSIKREYFEEIGYSTTESLNIASKYIDKITIIASGGIRHPLDIIKSLALGASAVGISKTFLEILENKGTNKLIATINQWKKDLLYLMLITNSKNINELRNKVYRKDINEIWY